MRSRLLAAVVVIGVLCVPKHVAAQTCNVTNVLTNLLATATSCSGAFSGNDSNQGVLVGTELNNFVSGNWFQAGKTERSATSLPFSGMFPETPTGTLSFAVGGLTGPFALALKSGNGFSLYYFVNTGTIQSVSFTTAGVSGRRDLSHATLYRLSGNMNVVPEPSTYLLLATGLLGLGAVARRRRHVR